MEVLNIQIKFRLEHLLTVLADIKEVKGQRLSDLTWFSARF